MKPATQIVHWPGKDSLMCDAHAEQAKAVARAMGFSLSTTIILHAAIPEAELVCKNCENEGNKP